MLGSATLNGRAAGSTPILLLLSLASFVAACGGEKPNAQSGKKVAASAAAESKPSFDPCALLTKEEVEAAVGWKVAKTEVSGRGDYGHCVYSGRTDPMILPPEKAEAGILPCVNNGNCFQDLPDFRSSEEMAQWRSKQLEENKGAFEGLKPNVVPLKDYGVPAIDDELASMRSIDMQIGHKRVAYVSTWVAAEPTRELAKKVLARAH